VDGQKKILEGEGHKVIQKGKNYVIPDYEEKLILPPEIKF